MGEPEPDGDTEGEPEPVVDTVAVTDEDTDGALDIVDE